MYARHRPRIGIVADLGRATTGPWDDIYTMAPHNYVSAIADAGGAPVLIPSVEPYDEDPEAALADLDGIVFMGGRDFDPEIYGAAPHPESDRAIEIRDHVELAIGRAALERRMPILGICRGCQLLNILYGGDLEQHLADRVDMKPHRDTLGVFTRHRVALEPGTKLAAAMQASEHEVASHHHQGAGRIGDGLRVAATAPDGVVEGLEDPEHPFCIGVQWHPEVTASEDGGRLFRALVAQCSQQCSQMDRCR
ncbi:MAG: gamma-glutamyl-gamma-aminobutyrate hydrolase family protein [Acidobacteria bacterium]|nr:gamma-glutamyl-gamma-aminobutyrate hydrolase family protein [Acidobacteriota bacterium]